MAIYVPQPFDTGILGRPVYRLEPDSPGDIRNFTPPADAALVSLRLPLSWPEPPPETGFREVETLVRLERPLHDDDITALPPGIRLSTPRDGAACAALAATAFTTDRYHRDPMIANSIAERLKAAWGRNEASGRTDRTFIHESLCDSEEAGGNEGEIAGFNGCLLEGRVMIVDLIAVPAQHRGRGIGTRLLRAAFAHYAPHAARTLIATQASNTGALALYRKLGYRETSRLRTWHFTPGPIGFAEGGP